MPDPIDPRSPDSPPPSSGDGAFEIVEEDREPAALSSQPDPLAAPMATSPGPPATPFDLVHTVHPVHDVHSAAGSSAAEAAGGAETEAVTPASPPSRPDDWMAEDPLGRNWKPLGRSARSGGMPTWLGLARVWNWGRWLIALPLGYYLVLFVMTALPRLGYPFELEWFEGHLALQVQRVVDGQPQYPPLGGGWATYGYPPVYFWAVSIFYRLFGFAMLWGRLVSFLSTFLAAAGTALLIYDRTRKRLPAVVGGLILFAYFKPAGFWFDLFRVDMLAQALLAWGAWLTLKRRRKPWQLVIGIVLLALAPFTKQTVAPVSAVIFFLIFLQNWRVGRYALLLGLVFVFNGAAFLGAVPAKSRERWETHYDYLAANPQKHPFYWNRMDPDNLNIGQRLELSVKSPKSVVEFVKKFRDPKKRPEAWGKCYSLIAVPFGLMCLWMVATLLRFKRIRGGVWILFGGFLLAGSLSGWVMYGGFENNLIPAFWVAGLLFGLAYGGILRLLPRRWMRAIFDVVILGLIVVQYFPSIRPGQIRESFETGFKSAQGQPSPGIVEKARRVIRRSKDQMEGTAFGFSPASQQPAPGSVAKGREVIQWIADQDERVYVPHHVYLSYLAGRETYYSIDAVRDLEISRVPLPPDLIKRLETGYYPYLLLDAELQWEWLPGAMKQVIQQKYEKVGPVLKEYQEKEFLPVTGAMMKPRFVFRWKGLAAK